MLSRACQINMQISTCSEADYFLWQTEVKPWKEDAYYQVINSLFRLCACSGKYNEHELGPFIENIPKSEYNMSNTLGYCNHGFILIICSMLFSCQTLCFHSIMRKSLQCNTQPVTVGATGKKKKMHQSFLVPKRLWTKNPLSSCCRHIQFMVMTSRRPVQLRHATC